MECDVLVAGSGAGGLAAAVTAAKHGLSVIVAEKAPVFGGTTARSGGWLWIPNHPMQAGIGVADSVEEAATYLLHETGEKFDPERVNAFLAAGPRMVEWFQRETAVRFEPSATFSDYHPDAPGGKPGGRSIVAAPFDGRALGPMFAKLAPPLAGAHRLRRDDRLGCGSSFTSCAGRSRTLGGVRRADGSSATALARLFYGRGVRLDQRQRACWRGCSGPRSMRGSELWRLGPGRAAPRRIRAVRGALVRRGDREVEVRTRRGVVLACGGFPHDARAPRAAFCARGAFLACAACEHRRRAGGSPRRPARKWTSRCLSRQPGFRYRKCPGATALSGFSRISWIGRNPA
ncbi:MAG: FAD-dependent oxidoreductase [Burkholderiales bacterium]|nr:FAD-dependent oxidoreductase [Burkholderiales bacterium]